LQVPELLSLGSSLSFEPKRVTPPLPVPLSELAARGEAEPEGETFVAPTGEEERYAPEATLRALEELYSLYDGTSTTPE